MSITKYQTKRGERYRFTEHIGVDPVTGKRILITRGGFKTKKEAQSKIRELHFAFDTGNLSPSSSSTYQSIFDRWLPLYQKTVTPSTERKTEEYFRLHILPTLGSKRLSEITPAVCQAFLDDLAAKLMLYKGVYHTASRVYDYAKTLGLVQGDSPFDKVIMPRVKRQTEGTPFMEISELKDLLSHMENKKWHAYFRLLAYTGMRRGEALALTWEDLDRERQTVTISKTVTVSWEGQYISSMPKTAAGQRTIALDAGTIAVLDAYQPESQKGLIFPSREGGMSRLSKPRNYLKSIIKKYDLKDVTVHSFRHTHCSMLFEAGWSLKEVQERMGWADAKTCLNVYYHVTEKRKQKSMDSFLRYLEENE